ncbi:uncharacterized protein LOC123879835 [Maniola jurtina]|uniref:uncharacterized protein LOC123879835 n=1 Tax=Maniola jurtina TaxID=191418 RepID=UPI001E68B993|nr:uncharacterized protein LOC123879835 [Maniola jurtina]
MDCLNALKNIAIDIASCSQVLLATALVNTESEAGGNHVLRALLDQGSQACFITEAAVQLLRLKKTPASGIITGLGGDKALTSKYVVTVKLRSRGNLDRKIQVTAYVLKNITTFLPERQVQGLDWTELKYLQLADPYFETPKAIDMLLGANVYSQIVQEGIKKSQNGKLIAQKTTLGWILSGSVNEPFNRNDGDPPKISVMHAKVTETDILKQFWELEEERYSTKSMWTEEEKRCEEIFVTTTKRTDEGRYIVKLPFRDSQPGCLGGDSRQIAVTKFKTLEKRLSKNSELKEKYTEVINEYLHLGHMRAITKDDMKKNEAVYLPHHAVIRNDKTTSKVRVVFNASSKNNLGVSLNDNLMIGPKLQSDLRHTVIRWRVHPIALVADIIKMYRQVRIAEEDTMFQRIVWRDSPETEIQDYELLTVTFGTASAPYLAVRALNQVSLDEEQAKTENKKKKKLDNEDKMIEDMENIKDKKDIEIKTENTTKVLGLTWDRSEDQFRYSVNLPHTTPGPETKRSVLSVIARLYDPLGWIAPSIIVAKMFIQKLWLAGVNWDEPISEELRSEWVTYRNELEQLTKVQVPRWLGISTTDSEIELHGFCDASKLAYAVVVYLRIVDSAGNRQVSLLAAKTRVSPIKQVSIPRLELCGAALLSRLLAEVADVLSISKNNIRAWTDSTVVLSWLNSHPSRWKTFVANRVAEILTTMDSAQWYHVSSKENPADCESRGLQPGLLAENELWFSGPQFLREQTIKYKKPTNVKVHLEEAISAAKELQQLNQIQRDVAEYLATNGAEWHFIPPHAPNFGGLWEAGVKATKFHLKRAIGESTLTFEEMCTLLSQIEACLNSRPISIDSSDPSDPRPLTPGHFLIGGPLIAIPEVKDYLTSNVSSLTRWQFIQRMLQSFWQRWSQEYLSHLMNRYKWSSRVPEPNLGDIVLIKEDNLPPSRWLMGRVLEKHPGTDNVTRVVTIKVKNSTIKRPTSKLCILPVSE